MNTTSKLSIAMMIAALPVTGFAQSDTMNDRNNNRQNTNQTDRQNLNQNNRQDLNRNNRQATNSQPVRLSQQIGKDVYNNQGQKIGDIEDIVIDGGQNEISYAVLSFGGFMGMGDKFFAIPWSAIEHRAGQTDRVYFNIEQQRLENAPGFDKDNWPDTANQTYRNQVDSYYGVDREADRQRNQQNYNQDRQRTRANYDNSLESQSRNESRNDQQADPANRPGSSYRSDRRNTDLNDTNRATTDRNDDRYDARDNRMNNRANDGAATDRPNSTMESDRGTAETNNRQGVDNNRSDWDRRNNNTNRNDSTINRNNMNDRNVDRDTSANYNRNDRSYDRNNRQTPQATPANRPGSSLRPDRRNDLETRDGRSDLDRRDNSTFSDRNNDRYDNNRTNTDRNDVNRSTPTNNNDNDRNQELYQRDRARTQANFEPSNETAAAKDQGLVWSRRASNVIGADVHNLQNEDIGEIHDIIVDPSTGKVKYAILSFGGVMGMGDKLFAVPADRLHTRAAEEVFTINVSKEDLENARGFDNDNWPNWNDAQFEANAQRVFKDHPMNKNHKNWDKNDKKNWDKDKKDHKDVDKNKDGQRDPKLMNSRDRDNRGGMDQRGNEVFTPRDGDRTNTDRNNNDRNQDGM